MEAKEIFMKKAGVLLALICILSLTGCRMAASVEEEISQPDTKGNVVSVNLDDVATQSDSKSSNREKPYVCGSGSSDG